MKICDHTTLRITFGIWRENYDHIKGMSVNIGSFRNNLGFMDTWIKKMLYETKAHIRQTIILKVCTISA